MDIRRAGLTMTQWQYLSPDYFIGHARLRSGQADLISI
jgi:hypothetical protein